MNGALHGLLDAAVSSRPEANAVRDSRGCWTYAELHAASRQVAWWLWQRGIRCGDRVLITAMPERRTAAMLYGCSRVGAVFVPVSPQTGPLHWRHFVDDAAPALVVAEATRHPVGGVAALTHEQVWQEAIAASPREPPGPGPGGDDTAMLIYTSGSTAAPKAVVCPHKAVRFVTDAVAQRLGYHASDVVFCRLPLSFDYGIYQILLCARATCELVLAGADGDSRLLAALRGCAATIVPIVPLLATMLLRHRARDSRPTGVRLFTNTGERLTPATINRLRDSFPAAAVQLMFGTTECKRITISAPDGDLIKPESVGWPLPGTTVQILDDDGHPVTPGDQGEIVVSGPHVMAGYWRDEEASARVFRRDPVTGQTLLHGGDFGHLDQDGHLYFHGRRDSVFKQHGIRTSTAEIEAAAQDVPGVAQAIAFPPTEVRTAAVVVATALSATEVLRQLRLRLDSTKVPAQCRVVAELPETVGGKSIDRR